MNYSSNIITTENLIHDNIYYVAGHDYKTVFFFFDHVEIKSVRVHKAQSSYYLVRLNLKTQL